MKKQHSQEKQHWQDWVNALLGAWIIASPWVVQHVMATAATPDGVGGAVMWNLFIVGAAVAVFALIAAFAFGAWEEWVNLALGGWLLLSPWVVGFSASTALMWNAVIVGVLVAAFAAWVLLEQQGSKQLVR